MTLEQRMAQFCQAIQHEYIRARGLFPRFHSAHEAYAVLQEEVEEFWQEVKYKQQSSQAMQHELIQIAAMAMSTVLDLTLDAAPDQAKECNNDH